MDDKMEENEYQRASTTRAQVKHDEKVEPNRRETSKQKK